MSDDSRDNSDNLDKTNIVTGDTIKTRLGEAGNVPPALVLLMGPPHLVGKQWPLTNPEMSVGRVVEANIFVEDRSISKKHARVLVKNDEVVIEDLNSTNGTELNGIVIPAGVQKSLKNNDQIKVGNVIFKFLEKGNIETVAAKGTFDRTQIDALTQIYNRRALEATGDEVFRRAKLTETPLTVIIFDLDHFKMINDAHGHPGGDYVLREVASIVQNRLIRQGDFFARFGGEEFCLLLVGGSIQRGVEVADRIRQTIEKHDFTFAGKKIVVTLSAGVSSLEESMNTWADLFKRADDAAYLSKKNGRNRVSTL